MIKNCQLCGCASKLEDFHLEPKDVHLSICSSCQNKIVDMPTDKDSWSFLNDSMWSEDLNVQVLSYRLLNRLKGEGWAFSLFEQMYLDEEAVAFALFGADSGPSSSPKDSNGTILKDGDSVTLIKDLDVKGAGFTAKRGTLVKNISTNDNPEQIEGKVNGVHIVLLTKYLKKS